jgi:hypothetical protein
MPILLKHQPWNNDPGRPERDTEVEWNMWRSRQPPYHDLDVGSRVILVSGGGPTAGMLTWEVEVTAVAKGQYGSHEEAFQLLSTGVGRDRLKEAGVARRTFLAQDYTSNAPAAGWLLGWSYQPIRSVMLPRSSELRIGRNGWGAVDRLSVGGETAGRGRSGQGRLADPMLRKKVELAAMELVRRWLIEEGHPDSEINDTSRNQPYDYEVRPEDRPKLRVEVKGMVGALGPVEVTAGEVESARHGGVATTLAVVHGITLTLDLNGQWQASGGTLWLVEGWNPDDESLTPKRYSYDPR